MPGGEGSRGGQVIGHTRSGAPIYASQLSRAGLAAHRETAAAGARPPHPQGPIKAQSEVDRVRGLSHADYQREHAADLAAVAATQARQAKLRPRGNLDRPAVLNKPGYKPR